VVTSREVRSTAAERLDRLPITSFHRQVTWLLGFVFFAELGGVNAFSFAAPVVMNLWGISVSAIGFLVSGTFIGMFVGATAGGWFSDRAGRKKALIITTVWFSIFSLLNSIAWSTVGLFIARLLTGVGLSAMTVVGITYVNEFPANRRGAYQGWINSQLRHRLGLRGWAVFECLRAARCGFPVQSLRLHKRVYLHCSNLACSRDYNWRLWPANEWADTPIDLASPVAARMSAAWRLMFSIFKVREFLLQSVHGKI
jgi:predicted MFS family arabinose efflux permease